MPPNGIRTGPWPRTPLMAGPVLDEQYNAPASPALSQGAELLEVKFV